MCIRDRFNIDLSRRTKHNALLDCELLREVYINLLDVKEPKFNLSPISKDSIDKNDNVLIIDDLIATGGTAEAAAKLVDISHGKVAGFIFVINLFDLSGSNNLKKQNYKVENLIEFPGH